MSKAGIEFSVFVDGDLAMKSQAYRDALAEITVPELVSALDAYTEHAEDRDVIEDK